jgi:hypothetical protein
LLFARIHLHPVDSNPLKWVLAAGRHFTV